MVGALIRVGALKGMNMVLRMGTLPSISVVFVYMLIEVLLQGQLVFKL